MICARSEVGLSRLPVTEEIAGSNPVERATDIFTPRQGVFLWKNIPYLLHFCTIYVIIWSIGLEGLRSFYNKISDNVRGRIPSVMARNYELNPSDSKLPKKIIALFGAAAFTLGAAGCNGETHSEPTPDTTTSTVQETQSPTPETTTPSLLKTPEQVRQEYREVMPQKPVDVDETADKLNRGEEPLETLTEFIKKQGFSFPHIDEKIPTLQNCISVEKKDAADKLGSQVGSVIAVTSMLQNPEYGLDKTSVNTITDSMAETFVDEDYRQGFKDSMYYLGKSIGYNLDHPDDDYPVPAPVPGTQASAVLQAKASEGGCYGAWYHGKDLRNPYGTGAGDVQIDRYGIFGTNFYQLDGFNNYSGDVEPDSLLKALVTHHKKGDNLYGDNSHSTNANLGEGAWIIHMEESSEFNYNEDGKETTIKVQDQ